MKSKKSWVLPTIRILLGLFLLFFGAQGLYALLTNSMQIPDATAQTLVAMEGLIVSGIIHVAKVIQIVVGLMLLFNYKPAFAALLIAPISVGIIVFVSVLYWQQPAFLIPGLLLLAGNIYLGFAYWSKYKTVFT